MSDLLLLLGKHLLLCEHLLYVEVLVVQFLSQFLSCVYQTLLCSVHYLVRLRIF